ncbi:MAG: hypothetical protein P4L85_11515 [Paludisphaera borealis]|uniref:hypothetical protein n=1 Tax=Paludisphaera borealis TaxID=1387353 RepID=UPI00284DA05F|nr:hypothetical protein [Paludisphaera borealis]MDR3619969.1 hypothetical protein [Paludisphaera borealis]
MKIRSLVLAAVPVAFCFCLTGCDSGGVEAVSAKTKVGAVDASTASSGTVPKTLPQSKRKNRSEAPGPRPAPEI